MKKITSILLIGLALTVSLFSCKDDEDDTKTPMLSNAELITMAPWKILYYSTSATDSLSTSVVQEWNNDLNTNPLFVTYYVNGTYMYSDSSDFGTWELSGTNSIIFEKGTSEELTATIDTLTSNSFALTYPWKMDSTLTVNVKETAGR